MVDRRQNILNRLVDLLMVVAADNGLTFVHNRGELPDDKRPALTLFDSHEVADQRAFERGRLGAAPNIMRMTPEIYVILKDRKPNNVDVGKDLNGFRLLILKTVLLDQTLQDLIGTNGEMRYDGCVTDLAKGQAMDGELGMTISFAYPFQPREL